MVKYCDRCKWNDRYSWADDDLDENGELTLCPNCDNELWEAKSYEEIP